MQLETPEKAVEFRYASIPADGDELSIIVLGYPNEEAARESYATIHSYITASGRVPRFFLVKFERDSVNSSRYDLEIVVSVEGKGREIGIHGILADHVERLRRSLSTLPCYLIAAGYYTDDRFQLLPLEDFNFFRAVVEIDGEEIHGRNKPGFDPYALLSRASGT